MNLQEFVQETVKQFEKTLAPYQLNEIEQVNQLFEEMVTKGLIQPPTYNSRGF